MHVHTNVSDGRGTPQEVVAAAARSGADFIVITDHNRTDALASLDAASPAGSRPLVLVGAEVSTEAGHVLALGIRPPSFRFSGTLSEVLDDIQHLGGCAFAAHPTSARGETRFSRETEPGSWGVELVNGDSAWREASIPRLALSALTYPASRAYSLTTTLGEFRSETVLWDRLLAKRFVPAIAGTDAHGRIPITRNSSLPLPSYESLFGLVRTVALLKTPLSSDANQARGEIVRALCEGRSFLAIPTFADPTRVTFEARAGERVAGPGERLQDDGKSVELEAGGAVPQGALGQIFRDGVVVASGSLPLRPKAPGPGVYRLEIRVGRATTPWVISNPIEVLNATALAAREAAARPPSATLVEGETSLDSFDGPTTAFAAEFDPTSNVVQPILDSGAGRNGGGALRLKFSLSPGPQTPVWTALVARTPRDMSASRALSFWMKADGEYRMWVQLRDKNPASADEGTEAWFASVRTSKDWTLYNVPFASLRSINRTSDGSFDPKTVQHIVFVIDHGAMPLGSMGTIWLDDLRTVKSK